MRASTSSSSAGDTRSVLLSTITSAKAIWFLASGASFKRFEQPFGVGQRHHRVEPRRVLHVGVDEKGLRDGRGVREAGRFDNDRVEPAAPAHQPLDDADQIAAHGAADAAVVHLEDFLVGADDEIIVDADLAELVDDDRVAAAVLFGEYAVQQRRLAGAEIAGDDGDGNFVGQSVPPRTPLSLLPPAGEGGPCVARVG